MLKLGAEVVIETTAPAYETGELPLLHSAICLKMVIGAELESATLRLSSERSAIELPYPCKRTIVCIDCSSC